MGFTYGLVTLKNNAFDESENDRFNYTIDNNPWNAQSVLQITIMLAVSIPIWAGCLWRIVANGKNNERQCCRKPIPPPSMISSEMESKTVVVERHKVTDLKRQPKDCILVVDDIQTFDFFPPRECNKKVEPGTTIGPVYFHDRVTRGIYTTKGVSFSMGYNERLAILNSAQSGSEDLFLTIVGQKQYLAGSFIID